MRIVVILLVLGAAAVPALSHFIVRHIYLPRWNSAHYRFVRLTPKILADLETVNKQPPFDETLYERDAGPLLAKYVSWEGSAVKAVDYDRVRALFNRYSYWKEAAGQLKQLMDDPAFSALDTAWMESLEPYDHWKLDANPEVGAKLKSAAALDGVGRMAIFASLPIPNYGELRSWATLHVLKRFAAGKAREGMEVLRKAAQLAHSSGTLVGNMAAVAMLKDEHFLAEKFKIDGWPLVPMQVIEAYQRVSWAWVSVAGEAWFNDIPEKFQPFFRSQLGLCAAAWELNAGSAGLQDYLEPRFLFETDFSENLQRVRQFQRRLQDKCRVGAAKAAWEKSPLQALSGWNRVPYIRRILGMALMTVAVPNYLQIYERQSKN